MTSRRQFLGAAAALAALPATSTADTSEDEEIAEDETYAVTDFGALETDLNWIDYQSKQSSGPVEIQAVHDPGGWSGVDLEWKLDPIHLGASLDPDSARELADRLRAAADEAEGRLS